VKIKYERKETERKEKHNKIDNKGGEKKKGVNDY
jgi:hypothetical protein